MFAGVFIGVVTGLTPGIHVNTVTALLLISSASLASLGIDYSVLLMFVCALALAHTFFDVIPGLFLGVPGDETFALLPGHRLVKNGHGILAIRLSVIGSASGLAIGVLSVAALVGVQKLMGMNLIGDIESQLSSWLFWVLAAVSLLLIATDHNVFWSASVFLASGALGVLVLGAPVIPGGSDAPVNVLFPSLAGLFGIAGTIWAIATSSATTAPVTLNESVSGSKINTFNPSVRGGIAGSLVGLLPGLGAANAATLLLLIEQRRGKRQDQETEDKSYLVTTSSLNTVEAVLSIAALYLIDKSRSGASIAVDQILGGIVGVWDMLEILLAMVAAGGLAALIMWVSGRALSIRVSRMSGVGLNWAVILFLVTLTYFLLGFGGIAVLVCASVVGMLPLVTGVRRAQLMGFFLVPTLLFYSGYSATVVDLLSIEARMSPSVSSLSIQYIGGSIAIALFVALVIYQLVARSGALLHGPKPITLFSSVFALITIVLTLLGMAHPIEELAFPVVPDGVTVLDGKVTHVVDGDTLDVGHAGRRYRLRLAGLDAPELDQPHGGTATAWLANAIGDGEISWQPVGVDVYGRILATIEVNGVSLNREMVGAGHAWVYPGSRLAAQFKSAEDRAQGQGTGLWAGASVVAPWEWRNTLRSRR